MNFKNIDFNKITQSKAFKFVFVGIAFLIVFLLVFKVGMMVGFKKAEFTGKWSDNYYNNFAGPQKGFAGQGLGDNDFLESNGVSGQIIQINTDSVVIKDRNNIEKYLFVDAGTIIKKFQDTILISDLKNDDFIVVIGSPNSLGQIQAKLIRVMPSTPLPTDALSGPGPF